MVNLIFYCMLFQRSRYILSKNDNINRKNERASFLLLKFFFLKKKIFTFFKQRFKIFFKDKKQNMFYLILKT